MASISKFPSAAASPPLQNPLKSLNPIRKPQISVFNHSSVCNFNPISVHLPRTHPPPPPLPTTKANVPNQQSPRAHLVISSLVNINPHFFLPILAFPFPLSCLASEAAPEQVSNKINLESVVISIDDFFTKYPFFVPSVLFIWLIAIPLTEEYLQKYKFISAINAFRKLQDDPSCQLLDIRDPKSLAYLNSPNLKILNKTVLQVEFRLGDEDGFVKTVSKNFEEPAIATVCVIDNFDGNSIKVAELLVKNGFKEAYAVRGGIRGKKGWQEIQETLLPTSVHIYPKKRSILSNQLETNQGILRQDKNISDLTSIAPSSVKNSSKKIDDKDFGSTSPAMQSKGRSRPSSPYPNYPELKPPSSPTPSRPK
ncbi:rhodanese-like domain-containing protein 4A, chloroplastic [Primulina eburnea]|uniref:rhodanese-like domain-containing protein 4A, chloroplastic n=1 Tax=Primulina eburnea TaxID=1245227 RepID=UPI003C6CA40F